MVAFKPRPRTTRLDLILAKHNVAHNKTVGEDRLQQRLGAGPKRDLSPHPHDRIVSLPADESFTGDANASRKTSQRHYVNWKHCLNSSTSSEV
jgi:hypothetical protein